MNISLPGFEDISRQLSNLENSRKLKMLVVDDEPDNLDLLYRTFRRNFQVLKAESGGEALEILAREGEVAVIISDQRMPEMKGTEFLSKTVPQFPDTVRIILTGFTDVEDLVEAINSGQVYKYITKPWDPNELKGVVQRAADTYETFKKRTDDLQRAQAQAALLNEIVQMTCQTQTFEAFLQTIAATMAKGFNADHCIFQIVDDQSLAIETGLYGNAPADWLAKASVVQTAIATQAVQAVLQPADLDPAQTDLYHQAEIQAHLVMPLVFQEQVLAVLSLQWQQPCPLALDDLPLLYLASRQVTLALSCTRCRRKPSA